MINFVDKMTKWVKVFEQVEVGGKFKSLYCNAAFTTRKRHHTLQNDDAHNLRQYTFISR